MRSAPGGVIAGCFALSAFTVAVLSGLAAGNAATTIMLRSVLALLFCYPLGIAVGALCNWIIESHTAAVSAATEEEDAVPSTDAVTVAGATDAAGASVQVTHPAATREPGSTTQATPDRHEPLAA